MAGKRLVKYVKDYIVFDLETTGISAQYDSIIEISGVKVRNGQIVDTFSTLVNPERSIPAAASKVNHITDDMVKDAPKIDEALTCFFRFVGTDVLVGHNIHSFDLKFIYRDAQRIFNESVENDYIDTLQLARKCLPQLSHHRLTDVSSYFGISTDGAHRALNDCIMNQKCYEALAKIQKTDEIIICPQCGGELVKRNGRYGTFWGCSSFPKCRYTEKC